MENKSLSVARPAIFSTAVFGKHGYNVLFLRFLELSLNSWSTAGRPPSLRAALVYPASHGLGGLPSPPASLER
jgi:hypothetical protein